MKTLKLTDEQTILAITSVLPDEISLFKSASDLFSFFIDKKAFINADESVGQESTEHFNNFIFRCLEFVINEEIRKTDKIDGIDDLYELSAESETWLKSAIFLPIISFTLKTT